MSLPNPVLQADRWSAVAAKVSEVLATPVGLRSLTPDNSDYRGTYVGDVWARDAAYHQGTVWSWLLGPYLDVLDNILHPYRITGALRLDRTVRARARQLADDLGVGDKLARSAPRGDRSILRVAAAPA